MSSLVGSDGTSGVALERRWVEWVVIMTSVAILMEAQREELGDSLVKTRVIRVAVS